jgi:SH3/ankyrin repeat-containing protein
MARDMAGAQVVDSFLRPPQDFGDRSSSVSNGSVSLGAVPAATDSPVIRIRITVPETEYRDVLSFNGEEIVWVAKQRVLSALGKDAIKDGLNYGLYCPESNGRYGKFLDEERQLKDYPLPGPIANLEFKYKRREYKTQINPSKLKKLHSQSNLKQFMECIKKTDVEGLMKWINKGLDPNFNSLDKGDTPLTLSSTLPRPRNIMMALISGGAFLDYRNRQGRTAMHVAAICGNRDAIRTLLDLGASPNYKDAEGLTPLYHCVMNHDNPPQCTQMLLHDRADVGYRDINGWTELHQACKNGLVQHLEHLLFYGADINAQTTSNDTPLHICARFDKEECARVLMFRGANRTLKNASGEDPCQVAVASNHRQLADIIMKFRPEEVVLYNELPKYNDKRRGTISMATLRNLQRSRSNPQLHLLFQQDPGMSASLSPGTGQPYIASGQAGIPATVSGHVTAIKVRGSLLDSFSERAARQVVIRRDAAGFGFVLRGSKGQNSSTQTLDFKPSAEIPALQYFETVTPGSAAYKAGLQSGDFLLEISGENVVNATHDRCVQLIKAAGDTLMLRVTRPSVTRPPGASPETLQRVTNNTASSQSSPSSSVRSTTRPVDGLAELEKLDATLDTYDGQSGSGRRTVSSDPSPSLSYNSLTNGPVYATVAARADRNLDSNINKNIANNVVSGHTVVNGYSSKPDDEPPPDYDIDSGRDIMATSGMNGRDMQQIGVSAKKPAAAVAVAPPPPPPPLPANFNMRIPASVPMAPAFVSQQSLNSPLKPIQSSGMPQISAAGSSQAPLPPQVQRQLEETKKRDESHAALLAAVRRRRNLLESTDGDQVASAIENRVQRTSKLQIVYKAGMASGEQRTSVAVSPTGLLAPAGIASAPKLAATLPPQAPPSATTATNGNGYLAEAEKKLLEFQGRTAATAVQKTAPVVAAVVPIAPSSLTNSRAATEPAASRQGALVPNSSAPTTSSTTRVSVAPPPIRAAAPADARYGTASAGLTSVPIIPPPAEFASEPVTNAMPVTATLRSVAKPQTNSMVFRAAARTSTTDGMTNNSTKTVVWPPKHFTDRKMETWSVDEVCEWLETLDLGIYRKSFMEYNVSGKMLAGAREQDLVGFGISMPLHRVKLERELRKFAK